MFTLFECVSTILDFENSYIYYCQTEYALQPIQHMNLTKDKSLALISQNQLGERSNAFLLLVVLRVHRGSLFMQYFSLG